MKRISLLMTGMLLAALASSAYSQSLAELAKKEKERRQAIKTDTKVVTLEQVAKFTSTKPVTETLAPGAAADTAGAEKPVGEKPATEGTAADATGKDKARGDEPVDFQGRPESFWRQTFGDARQKVKELENEANVIVLKLNDLQNRFYREADGFKQQQIQRDIQKAFYEQDLNKENLAKARTSLADLETEARKSGALPGWIK